MARSGERFSKKARTPRKAGEETEIQVSPTQKFEWIRQITSQPEFARKVRGLCALARISRSGYYAFLSEPATTHRQKREARDIQDHALLWEAYRYKGYAKGARQLKMTLQLQFGLTYNLKRIGRLMKKFHLVCTMRRMARATQEHRTCPNTLQRAFKPGVAGKCC